MNANGDNPFAPGRYGSAPGPHKPNGPAVNQASALRQGAVDSRSRCYAPDEGADQHGSAVPVLWHHRRRYPAGAGPRSTDTFLPPRQGARVVPARANIRPEYRLPVVSIPRPHTAISATGVSYLAWSECPLRPRPGPRDPSRAAGLGTVINQRGAWSLVLAIKRSMPYTLGRVDPSSENGRLV